MKGDLGCPYTMQVRSSVGLAVRLIVICGGE